MLSGSIYNGLGSMPINANLHRGAQLVSYVSALSQQNLHSVVSAFAQSVFESGKLSAFWCLSSTSWGN